eukprot:1836806-Rhodomonas_salina.2
MSSDPQGFATPTGGKRRLQLNTAANDACIALETIRRSSMAGNPDTLGAFASVSRAVTDVTDTGKEERERGRREAEYSCPAAERMAGQLEEAGRKGREVWREVTEVRKVLGWLAEEEGQREAGGREEGEREGMGESEEGARAQEREREWRERVEVVERDKAALQALVSEMEEELREIESGKRDLEGSDTPRSVSAYRVRDSHASDLGTRCLVLEHAVPGSTGVMVIPARDLWF